MDEIEVYRQLDAMLPAFVDRDSPEISLEAGEVEAAITSLLCEAVDKNYFPDEVKAFIRSEYDEDSAVIDMLEALEQYIAQNIAD